MATKKPAKQTKTKDLDIAKTKGGEKVKGGLLSDSMKQRGNEAGTLKRSGKW